MPYNFPMLAWFLARLLDRLGYDAFDVLGISWGGGLAQQVAFQHPRRCRRLVLVSTATGSLMVPASPLVLRKMLTPRRYRDPDYAATIAAQLYGGRMRDEPDAARTLLHEQSRDRIATRLPAPAARRRRLDQPARAAASSGSRR